MPPLVQPLFDGPLDIVGDVHGENEALCSLLKHLGYGNKGHHSEGRRLVFLGDLTDRGPDSPAVVECITGLIDAGQAKCVLGNHDLNILLGHKKPENKWFWGEDFLDEAGKIAPQKLADAGIQQRVLSLFGRLPLALERDDLKIVHACWDEDIVGAARHAANALELYNLHRHQIDIELSGQNLDKIDRGLKHQNLNPVKMLTSGPEVRTDTPVVSGGKVRHEQRVEWWHNYRSTFCVFGHYSIADGNPRGNTSAFCVDYGVGQRWKERRAGKLDKFSFKLAAIRFPEKEVVFDDGSRIPLPDH